MDPITLAIGAAGIAAQVFGGIGGAFGANKVSALQKQEAANETAVNDQRAQQMELSNRRQQTENFRNIQRARAMGLEASVNQGAQFGSGMAGGQAQAQDQGAVNTLGLDQNLTIGRNIFALNDKISSEKADVSSVQSGMATDNAIAGFGAMLTKGAGTMSNIFQGFGGGSNSGGFQGMMVTGGPSGPGTFS